MKIFARLGKKIGHAEIEIEGFFTERVINICKTQNIAIWNIINITEGTVRFCIAIVDIKKIKPILKKTKCKMKILKKKGLYFQMFKYRKRKIVVILLAVLILMANIFNKFIWNVEVIGNEILSYEEVIEKAKIAGVYVGKYKKSIDILETVQKLNKEIPSASWIGLEYKGITAIINIVEKTTFPKEVIYDKNAYGSIYANKSGVITKIIPENGTAIHKEGSYVEEGMKLIDGKIISEVIGDYPVRASGIIKMDVEYIFEKEYKYEIIQKEFTGKKKYNLGFSVNDKEISINYLNKSKKYDKLKKSRYINIFDNVISLDFYTFSEFNEIPKVYTYDELIQIAQSEKELYVKSLVSENSSLSKEEEIITKNVDGITYKVIITINENIGVFKGE